jgi:hypothetical protein
VTVDEKPRVFVVNEPLKGGERTMDLSAAVEFGQLVHLTRAGALPNDPREMIEQIWKGLKTFREVDHLLLVGNPAAIGVAVALATARTGGVVKMLRWHRRGFYEVVTADMCEALDDLSVDADAPEPATLGVDLATGEAEA